MVSYYNLQLQFIMVVVIYTPINTGRLFISINKLHHLLLKLFLNFMNWMVLNDSFRFFGFVLFYLYWGIIV